MVYNEQQLESFSRRAFKYEEQKIIDTHHAIRDAINEYFDSPKVKTLYGFTPELDIYLQGSYKNSTNVTKSSDVDLVVQLKSLWVANKETLPADQEAKYNAAYITITYPFVEFNAAIFEAIQQHFGAENVSNENKCLKIKEHGKFCSADVIPSFTYRHYGFFDSDNNQRYVEGMYFITNEGAAVINYPRRHYDQLSLKSYTTNGLFKETVRMFKNMRDDLTDKGVISEGIAKSYYIENLLFQVPNNYFNGTYRERFDYILDFFIHSYQSKELQKFICANGIDKLCSEKTWNSENVAEFLLALIKVRDENQL